MRHRASCFPPFTLKIQQRQGRRQGFICLVAAKYSPKLPYKKDGDARRKSWEESLRDHSLFMPGWGLSKRSSRRGPVLKFSWTFRAKKNLLFFYKFLILLGYQSRSYRVCEVSKYYFWNDDSFIRRENCERFCFPLRFECVWTTLTLSGIVYFLRAIRSFPSTPTKSEGACTPIFALSVPNRPILEVLPWYSILTGVYLAYDWVLGRRQRFESMPL